MTRAHVGILLAAGLSRRMGRLKQTMPVPGDPARRPMAAMAYDALAPFCARIIVVLGHQAPLLRAALEGRPFEECTARGEEEMLESVKAGLRAALAGPCGDRAARGEREPACGDPGASLLLLPADHPLILCATIAHLLGTASARPSQAVMPEYEGRGGHPVIVPRALVPRILRWDGSGGLRAFWLSHPELAHREPVTDRGAVRDFDTPLDAAEE